MMRIKRGGSSHSVYAGIKGKQMEDELSFLREQIAQLSETTLAIRNQVNHLAGVRPPAMTSLLELIAQDPERRNEYVVSLVTKGVTMDEVADLLGMSKSRVSQVYHDEVDKRQRPLKFNGQLPTKVLEQILTDMVGDSYNTRNEFIRCALRNEVPVADLIEITGRSKSRLFQIRKTLGP